MQFSYILFEMFSLTIHMPLNGHWVGIGYTIVHFYNLVMEGATPSF